MSHSLSTVATQNSCNISHVPVSSPVGFDIDHVCDGLEQRGFVHIHNPLLDELLKSLYGEIKLLDENYALQRAGLGRGDDHLVETSIRRDKIHWLTGDTLAQCQFHAWLEQIRIDINYRLMLGLFSSESQFAVYRKGDFYKRHLDSFKGEKNRILSMVIYLNPNWCEADGGLLNVYETEASETPFARVVPVWGNAVLFLSEDIPHEVTPTDKTRYSIATWFRCNNENPLL